MSFRTLSAETIASWEQEVGPTPIHGVALELLRGGAVEPHSHSRGQLMLAESGVMTVSAAGECWVISGSRALWVPEAVVHSISSATSVKLRNLQLSRLAAPMLPDRPCMVAATPLFRELVLSAIAGPNRLDLCARQEKIISLIVDEFSESELSPIRLPQPRDTRLKRICSALCENAADNRTLDQWAEIACASPRTLERLFVKETGVTFAQWRRQLRLLDGLIRLGCGQSVTTVALDVGYESASAFIKVFREQFGKTPGQYFDQ